MFYNTLSNQSVVFCARLSFEYRWFMIVADGESTNEIKRRRVMSTKKCIDMYNLYEALVLPLVSLV